jgi:hypothetical protein
MELARTLRILWGRRRLVALGAVIALIAAILSVYRVSLMPPSLESRTNVFATASSQILVDTPDSAVADLSNEIEPLNTRATVFARFLASPAAVELIAREAKLPFDAIEAQGPFELNLPEVQQAPTAEKRSSQIIGEGALYRLRFENNSQLPIITTYAQAPTQEGAVKLAAAVPVALRAYVDGIQDRQQTPENRKVMIRTLGRASGGVVNPGASKQIFTLVFLTVLIGWCLLLIPAHTIARGWRDLDNDGNPDPAPGRRGFPERQNGSGHQEGQRRPVDPERGTVRR